MKLVLAAVLAAVLTASLASSVDAAPASGVMPAAATTDACGSQPLKPDGTPWRCTFADNFSGTSLDRAKWVPQTYFMTGSTSVYACYRDDPSNVRVGGGVLRLTLVRLAAPEPCVWGGSTDLMSGGVSTYHLFSQQYGRFEARMKDTATTYPGLHEAFWMWPDNRYGATSPWPDSGEIDVAETFSIHPYVSVAALHYSADAQGLQPGVNMNNCAARRGVWNTFRLEWGPSRIEFFVNGRSCLVNTSADPAFAKPYILNLTQGIGPGDMGNMPVARTPIPATLQVDYVKVWR